VLVILYIENITLGPSSFEFHRRGEGVALPSHATEVMPFEPRFEEASALAAPCDGLKEACELLQARLAVEQMNAAVGVDP